MTLVTVSSSLHKPQQHNKTSSNLTMSRMPFKPLTPRKSIVSSHPKSVFDRETSHSKSGITLARHRDQSAFRTAKSRKLKALHGSSAWQKLSESQRHDAEAEIVVALEQQLEEKMAAHTLEWRRLVESGEVSDNADMIDEGDYETAEPGGEKSQGHGLQILSSRERERMMMLGKLNRTLMT